MHIDPQNHVIDGNNNDIMIDNVDVSKNLDQHHLNKWSK